MVAGRGQMAAGRAHRVGLRGVRAAPGNLRHQGHPDRADGWRALQRRVGPLPVTAVAMRHRGQRQAGVANGTGMRTLHRHQLSAHRAPAGRREVDRGHAAEPGPQADDAAAGGRNPDRAANVVAVADRADARRNGRAGATAGATGRDRPVQRVERAAVQGVVGEDAHRERRRVGASDQDGTRAPQVGHDRAVFDCDQILVGHHTVVRGVPLLVDIDLGRDRHAMQRAQRLAAGACGVGRVGGGQRFIVHPAHHRVQRGVHRVHARQAGLHRFARRCAAGADESGQVGGIELPEFHRGLLGAR